MIHLRAAELKDAELLHQISCETFYDTYAAFNTKEDMAQFLAVDFNMDKIVESIISPGYLILIAYVDQEPAGYVFLKNKNHESINHTQSIEIARIYARKSFIGKGVGAALLKASIDYAQQTHKKYLWLGVWKENHRAIIFYQKNGFERFGEQQFTLGNDVQNDWVMKLKIS